MNSGIQCLSNCIELTNYFLKDFYKKDINEVNPIGRKGMVANAYAEVMQNLWYGTRSDYSPNFLKRQIGEFQSMFSGFGQHDAQELLGYLLDALHEDLNRVLEKPIVPQDESTHPDDLSSKLEWENHLKRNQSIINDLFYGQFKTRIVCPTETCKKISVVFNSFINLSLPLAKVDKPVTIRCSFNFFDPTIETIMLLVVMNKSGTVGGLRKKIGDMLEINPFSFIIATTDYSNEIDEIIHTSRSIEEFERYSSYTKFHLFQIDPKLFCTNENNFYQINPDKTNRNYANTEEIVKEAAKRISKINQLEYPVGNAKITNAAITYYSKNSVGDLESKSRFSNKVLQINIDENYGLSSDYLLVMLRKSTYEYGTVERRRKLNIPNFIFIHKKWTLRKVHQYIFDSIKGLFSDLKDKTFKEVFSKLNDENQDDSLKFQIQYRIPYRLRFVNHNKKRNKPCFFCTSAHCINCIVPYEDDTVEELLGKLPSKNDLKVDNTFYFLDKMERGMISCQDLMFELSFLTEFEQVIKNSLEPAPLNEIKRQDEVTSKDIGEFLNKYSMEEELDMQNQWYCPDCKDHRQATIKNEIFKTPDIFIIHLKRFSSSRKLEILVDFPLEGLDMSPYVANKQEGKSLIYDCFAVSNHYGSTFGGHYTAYCQNPLSKKWYTFDDSSVRPMKESEVVTSSAYVLFYRRRGLKDSYLNDLYAKSFEKY